MLKRFIFAAGTLLVAIIGAHSPASAAYRTYYGHRTVATHYYYPRKAPIASRGQVYAQRVPTQRARLAYTRGRTIQNYRRTAQRYGTAQRVASAPRSAAAQRVSQAQRAAPAQRFAPAQRLAQAQRFGQAQRYGRAQRWRFATWRGVSGRRVAIRRTRLAVGRQDNLIRNYVGSSGAYAPVTGGTQVGNASYYGGGRTASGGVVGAATCAHRTLPFGTRVLVTNLANARQAVLTVNDRGPFIAGRIVDVSTGAAGVLGMLHSGTAPVRVQVVGGRS